MVAKQKLIDVPEAGVAVKAFEWFGQSSKYSYCTNPRKFAPELLTDPFVGWMLQWLMTNMAHD